MERLIDKLQANRRLDDDEYLTLLQDKDPKAAEYLHARAREVAVSHFGKGVYVRGLIEVGNRCRNNCYYCGIRRDNRQVERYSLTHDEILSCCLDGYHIGFRTFVLQGGDLGSRGGEELLYTVECIRRQFPDCAITLSLGEMDKEVYQALFDAGADRYLLRHEAAETELYERLHPREMRIERRMRCLLDLRKIGYQVGAGMMVGCPYQTVENLRFDLCFLDVFRPAMIGIGPFIPHPDTPFARRKAGSLKLTLKLISILRLMHPTALIPATTALATLSPEGRKLGIQAGANVVMPNLTPAPQRTKYALYRDKACMGAEAAEGVKLLEDELHSIGYRIDWGRGDHWGEAELVNE